MHPLAANQHIQFELAELAAEIDLVRHYNHACAEAYLRGEDTTRFATIAKLKTGRLNRRVADVCLQFHGGIGYMEETWTARYFRDSRLLSIGGGADEVMLRVLAQLDGIGWTARSALDPCDGGVSGRRVGPVTDTRLGRELVGPALGVAGSRRRWSRSPWPPPDVLPDLPDQLGRLAQLDEADRVVQAQQPHVVGRHPQVAQGVGHVGRVELDLELLGELVELQAHDHAAVPSRCPSTGGDRDRSDRWPRSGRPAPGTGSARWCARGQRHLDQPAPREGPAAWSCPRASTPA